MLRLIRHVVCLIGCFTLVSVAYAQAPVVSNSDLEARLSRVEQYLDSQRNAQLLQQLVDLEERLRVLQGQYEEQQHLLQRLEKRQRDVYLELDQLRNQQLSTPSAQASVGEPAPFLRPETLPDESSLQTSPVAVVPTLEPSISVDDALAEQNAYDGIYALIRGKEYDQAIAALDQFLLEYPQGKYAANAYYWQGQLYAIKKDLAKAEQALIQVVERFPSHHKSPDALVKLGIIYADQQQLDKAQQTLKQVIAEYPNTTAARLAQTRLQQLKAQP